MTARSRLAPLSSPAFLVALAVLVANDHFLKGSSLLPGWVTGKLSDVAGLVVAPLLLTVLVGARGRRARLLCFAAVSVGFAALEVAPPLAREVERVTRLVGLGWRLWPDPTDVLALGVLPLAWRTLHRAAVTADRARWLERCVGLLAIAACVATSGSSSHFESSVALVNRTHDEVELQLFRPLSLDCAEVAADPRRTLSPGDFELEACVSLRSLEAEPLSWDWQGDDQGEPRVLPPGPARACDAVLLRAEGLEDVVLFWNDIAKVEMDRFNRNQDDDAHLVHLENVGQRLVAAPPGAVLAFPPSSSPATAACPGEAP